MTFQFSNQDRYLDIHHYKQGTKEYTGTDSASLVKAHEGLPAHSTIDNLPLSMPEGSVARRMEGISAWEVVEDNRGKTVYAKNELSDINFTMTVLGGVPETHTIIEKPSKNHSFNEESKDWELDSSKVSSELLDIKSARKDHMRDQANSEIQSSFTSNALGSSHTYDSRAEDQSNLALGEKAAKVSTPQEALIYANNGTEYAYRVHTLSQIEQVMADCNAHIVPIRQKLISKKAAIDAAVDVDEVNSVNW